MIYSQVLELFEKMDSPTASGQDIKKIFQKYIGEEVEFTTNPVQGEEGSTEFVRVLIPGMNGKTNGGNAPTLGVVGRLGGIGARPGATGFVSDGDGALAALATGLKLADMKSKGDTLEGDVIVSTHIDPSAPTIPHDPVPFMASSVDIHTMNKYEVDEDMDAILSIDATKGNRVLNHTGIAVSPTVKEGYILRVSEDLLDVLQNVTGDLPAVLPITTQDITPYGNDVFHVNSILQPAVATSAPVVGVAVTAKATLAGCATGASRLNDVEAAARFSVEVAKLFGPEKISFHDQEEYDQLVFLYGKLTQLQTLGAKKV